jgi:hypothetical protein
MNKRSLKLAADDDEALIPLRVGASLLGLSTATIRQGKAGTENLTRVPQGRKLFLVKGEVLEHRRSLIKAARQTQEALKLVCPSE